MAITYLVKLLLNDQNKVIYNIIVTDYVDFVKSNFTFFDKPPKIIYNTNVSINFIFKQVKGGHVYDLYAKHKKSCTHSI